MKALNNPVGWFEIHVADLVRAKRFYEHVFNQTLWSLPSGDAQIQMLMCPDAPDQHDASGGLVKHPMKPPSTEGALIYFSCGDCEIQIARAIAHGGTIFNPKLSLGDHGFIAIMASSRSSATV